MGFHKTFLDILEGRDPLDIEFNKNPERDVSTIDIFNIEKTVDLVVDLAPYLMQPMKRPQELLKTTNEYYVARDLKTNTYYICYKDLLMIDIDTDKLTEQIDYVQFKQRLEHTGECYKVYKSNNGYHIFCISKRFNYRDLETVKTLLDFSCDFFYVVYCYIRGFSIRLNKKFFEKDDIIYKEICVIGNRDAIDSHLLDLVDLHIKLVKKYRGTLNIN